MVQWLTLLLSGRDKRNIDGSDFSETVNGRNNTPEVVDFDFEAKSGIVRQF